MRARCWLTLNRWVSPSPRCLGVDDQGRDILSYIPGGTTNHPSQRHAQAYRVAGRILRHLHDVTQGCALAGDQECVIHGDPGPFNAIFQDGLPVALIDWDSAAPGSRLHDLAYMAWTWCIQSSGNVPLEEQAQHLRGLRDGYGGIDPGALLDGMVSRQADIAATEATNRDNPRTSTTRRQQELRVEHSLNMGGGLGIGLSDFRCGVDREAASAARVGEVHVDDQPKSFLQPGPHRSRCGEKFGECCGLLVCVAAQRAREQLVFAAEGVVEASLADAERLDKILRRGAGEALLPEHLHRLVDGDVGIELLRPAHAHNVASLFTCRYRIWQQMQAARADEAITRYRSR